MIRYGCAGCHIIPGVPGAQGLAGPLLAGFAGRVYVGEAATNDSDNLVRWLVNPRSLDPWTTMPVTGVTESEAQAVASYLRILRFPMRAHEGSAHAIITRTALGRIARLPGT